MRYQIDRYIDTDEVVYVLISSCTCVNKYPQPNKHSLIVRNFQIKIYHYVLDLKFSLYNVRALRLIFSNELNRKQQIDLFWKLIICSRNEIVSFFFLHLAIDLLIYQHMSWHKTIQRFWHAFEIRAWNITLRPKRNSVLIGVSWHSQSPPCYLLYFLFSVFIRHTSNLVWHQPRCLIKAWKGKRKKCKEKYACQYLLLLLLITVIYKRRWKQFRLSVISIIRIFHYRH